MDFFDDDLEAAFDQLRGPRRSACASSSRGGRPDHAPALVDPRGSLAVILDVIGKLTDDGGIPTCGCACSRRATARQLDTGRLLKPDGTPVDSSTDHIDSAVTLGVPPATTPR